MDKNIEVPLLIPMDPLEFWATIRKIIREEILKNQKEFLTQQNLMQTNGLTEKPLYKIHEICSLFEVTKPTVYDWIKIGKLRKVKVRSRVYFLGSEVRQLMRG